MIGITATTHAPDVSASCRDDYIVSLATYTPSQTRRRSLEAFLPQVSPRTTDVPLRRSSGPVSPSCSPKILRSIGTTPLPPSSFPKIAFSKNYWEAGTSTGGDIVKTRAKPAKLELSGASSAGGFVDRGSPAFQIIVLGSGGGPSENNVSGYLVRTTATGWAKNSLLALDAGTHLGGIIRILENHTSLATSAPTPTGQTYGMPGDFPFEGAPLPGKSPTANASFITRELVSTYVLTHSHLDHLSGFVINTASFVPSGSPKRLAALPGVINAIKTHIFNNIIWPNLSDEDSGVGLVSYLRLPAGGDYIPVTDGMSVQVWPVSHGHCMKRHTHWGRKSTAGLDPLDAESNASSHESKWCVLDSAAYFIRDDSTWKEVLMWGDVEPDSISLDPRNQAVWEEAARKIYHGSLRSIFIECSYDNSQPDSTLYGHLSPRHLMVELKGLAQQVEELKMKDQQERNEKLKRKRYGNGYTSDDGTIHGRRKSNLNLTVLTRLTHADEDHEMTDTEEHDGVCTPPPETGKIKEHITLDPPPYQSGAGLRRLSRKNSMVEPLPSPMDVDRGPLHGVQVVITHIKDKLRDGEDVAANVLTDLHTLEADYRLGVTFCIAKQGDSIYT